MHKFSNQIQSCIQGSALNQLETVAQHYFELWTPKNRFHHSDKGGLHLILEKISPWHADHFTQNQVNDKGQRQVKETDRRTKLFDPSTI